MTTKKYFSSLKTIEPHIVLHICDGDLRARIKGKFSKQHGMTVSELLTVEELIEKATV